MSLHWLWFAACTPPEPTDTNTNTTTTITTTPDTGDTTVIETAATGDTATTPTTTTKPVDCKNLPSAPIPYTAYNIETTEDFDFDAQGRMVYAEWLGSNLFGVDMYGNTEIIAAGVADTRGIQTMSTGEIAIAYISEGRVGITDPTTGGSYTLISSLSGPNALEVGDGDILYFTETGATPRVRSYDIATGTDTAIAGDFTYPNGLALNETQDVLYVSDSSAGIWAVPKNKDGTWGDKYLVYNPAGFGTYDGMEVDVCGNLYVLGFQTGQVVRFNPDTLLGETIIDLEDPQAFLWNALRWGSDRGGWRRDFLYVTDRNKVFALEVGVRGRDQPVDLAP